MSTTSNGTLPKDARSAARYLLKRNIRTVPLPPRAKKCLLTDWQHLRLTEDRIDELFAPDANIGCLNGEPSGGLQDVDLDSPEAKRAASHLLPPTDMISGRASAPTSHWWYLVADPPAKAYEAYDDPLAEDDGGRLLELRSTGGQTVLPPSVYPADPAEGHPTDEPCVWHRHGEPARVELVELRRAVRKVAAAALLARVSRKGRRHDLANALAGGLLRAGWSEDDVTQFLTAWCAANQDNELRYRLNGLTSTAKKLLDDKEAKVTGWPTVAKLLGANGEAVVNAVRGWLGVTAVFGGKVGGKSGKSGVGSGAQTTYTPIPEYTPFPADVMPGKWAAFCREGARVLRCDAGYIALPALAVLAGAVGMTRCVYLHGEWYEPCVFWTCVVGVSGTVKSPAADLSVNLVMDVQKHHLAEFRKKMEEYTTELKEYRQNQRASRKNQSDPGDEPDKPVLKRVLVGDITIEKLSGILDDNNRGLHKHVDELAHHFGSFTRYKGQAGGSDETIWLSIYRCGPIIYDRKTGDKTSVFVPHAAVSVSGGIQPDVLRRLMGRGLFDSGTAARFDWCMPPRTPKEFVEDGIDDDLKKDVKESLDTLYALVPDADADGLPKPKVIRLSAEAKSRWKRHVNEWGKKQFETDGDLAAALAKLEGKAARFALLHHLVERGDGGEIGTASVEAGIRYVEWAAAETVRVYRTLHESEEATETRKLVELVTRLAKKSEAGDRLTPADLQRSRKERYPTAEAAEAALDSLITLNVGKWVNGTGKPGRGGRVSRIFVLNPIPDLPNLDDPEGEPDDGGEPNLPPDGPTYSGPGRHPDTHANPSVAGDSTSNPATGPESKLGKSGVGCESASADTPPVGQVGSGGKLGGQVGSAPEPARGFKWASELSGPGYVVVTDAGGLDDVEDAVRDSARVGLDLETTGLNPIADKIRLLSLHTDRGTFLIDVFRIDPSPLFDALAGTELVGHNLLFDLQFLARLGFTPGRVGDTMLASQVLDAGTPARHGLKDAAGRHLGRVIDKTEQKSRWTGELSASQLAYAAADAELPLTLMDTLTPKLAESRLVPVVELEHRALAAVAWMASKGVGFDRAAWQALATEAEAEAARLVEVLNDLAPAGDTLFGKAGRNWNSPDQVLAAFAAVGVTADGTDDDTLSGIDHPLAAALREHRGAVKRAGTYGAKWLKHVAADGRVYPGWRQLGAERTGRMSCKEPNAQNLPRDPRYRKCFIAPPGRVLVKADYSQIELRVAARIAGEKVMLAAYQSGKDLHAETAKAILGKAEVSKAEVSKADRQLAKAVNFGLLYGMGAKGLAAYARRNYGVGMSEAEAAAYRRAFFRAYPGLKRWHTTAGDMAKDTRTVLGRRRQKVGKFTERLNSPVQGTAGDGIKQALALLWERRSDCPTAFPVLAVHDEIVVECDQADADTVTAWLKAAMIDGMAPFADPVPVELEATVGTTWGG